MSIVEFLLNVQRIPCYDRVPPISDDELAELLEKNGLELIQMRMDLRESKDEPM